MATMTMTCAHVKTDRRLRLSRKHDTHAIMVITEGKQDDSYLILPLAANVETYEVTKLCAAATAHRYTCRLYDDGESCECAGWLSAGRCRHLEALNALRAAGRLNFDVALAHPPAAKAQTKLAPKDEAVEIPIAQTLGVGWCQGKKRRFPVAILTSGTHRRAARGTSWRSWT